jgi:hypothetical protein
MNPEMISAWQKVTGCSTPEEFQAKSTAAASRPRLLILLPGNPDQGDWNSHFGMLFLYLCQRFRVEVRGACGNNIYLVRQTLAKEAAAVKPDYVLWIDSDNLVTVEGFDHLYRSMEASPLVSIVGAWYFFPVGGGEIRIAAGWHPATVDRLVTLDMIEQATELIEVGYIGFGMCLMRGEIFQKTGPKHFCPILDDSEDGFMTDDAGFCFLAKELGYRTFLHPAVRVEHLKVMKVPAPVAGQFQTGEKENGNLNNSSGEQSELQVLDHHRA